MAVQYNWDFGELHFLIDYFYGKCVGGRVVVPHWGFFTFYRKRMFEMPFFLPRGSVVF